MKTNYFTKCSSVVCTEGRKGIVETENNTAMYLLPSHSLGKSLDLAVHVEILRCICFCDPLGFFSDCSKSQHADESGGSCKRVCK